GRGRGGGKKGGGGTPGKAGIWPQAGVAVVMAPKKAVTNLPSPRPRTHSASATWGGALRLANTAIQDTPATKLADNAVAASRANPNNTSVTAVPSVPAARSSRTHCSTRSDT